MKLLKGPEGWGRASSGRGGLLQGRSSRGGFVLWKQGERSRADLCSFETKPLNLSPRFVQVQGLLDRKRVLG